MAGSATALVVVSTLAAVDPVTGTEDPESWAGVPVSPDETVVPSEPAATVVPPVSP